MTTKIEEIRLDASQGGADSARFFRLAPTGPTPPPSAAMIEAVRGTLAGADPELLKAFNEALTKR